MSAEFEWFDQAKRHFCKKGKVLETLKKGSACLVSFSSVASKLCQARGKEAKDEAVVSEETWRMSHAKLGNKRI